MSATKMTNATNLKPRANVEAFRHTAADTMELVGNTPIVHLGRISPENGAAIYAKLEFLNPGGSIKDRAALGLILDAEQRGVLQPGGTVVEATAGNTGVGLAFIGVRRGYKVSLFVPEGFAEEKCILMRGFGATVERTPEDEGMQGAIRRALDFARSIPGAWMARQFDNPANPDFHFRTTAQEILDQMENRIDGFVAGVGTGGTFTGIARRLRQDLGAVRTVAWKLRDRSCRAVLPVNIRSRELASASFRRRLTGLCATPSCASATAMLSIWFAGWPWRRAS
jgi:cysteine synthase